MSKKITVKLIAKLIKGLRADVAHWEDFVTLEQRATEIFGVVNRTRSSGDRNVKNELTRVEEKRRWMLSKTRYLELAYDTDDGVALYLGDTDSDSEDVYSLFFAPILKPETKKARTPSVPKNLLTPERFVAAQDSLLNDSADIDCQSEFMCHILERLLGEPSGQNGDSEGNGSNEWYVGNAELILAWSKKGMTLKLKDTSAPDPEKGKK